MQAVRTLVLRHLHLGARPPCYGLGPRLRREMSASAGQDGGPRAGSESEDAVRARVVELVKKFDKGEGDEGSQSRNNKGESYAQAAGESRSSDGENQIAISHREEKSKACK
ncbi:uncharacterized protein LOC107303730 isoform X2 [Oryza brachyantha]|uniref:uncharacterized protein LOC107303730 isoform X2 n=1 Tax=Oryza brachyantha TaxID=4533 RepID=UPI0007768D6C|nr:uncharacterized protein LOC107303730 isoform X2 [Oryza brachyantha]